MTTSSLLLYGDRRIKIHFSCSVATVQKQTGNIPSKPTKEKNQRESGAARTPPPFESAIEVIQQEYNGMLKANVEFGEDVKKLTAEKKDLAKIASDRAKKVEKLTTDNNSKAASIERLKGQRNLLKVECDSLKQTCADMSVEMTNLKNENSTLKKKVKEQDTLIKGLNQEIERLNRSVIRSENANQAQQKRLVRLGYEKNDADEICNNDELPGVLRGLDKELIERINNEIVDSAEKVTFKDIAGLENVKSTANELVIMPMKRPDLFKGLRDLSGSNGLLLFGPPGTGMF